MIVSFYSYKGGVGRTQLCANVAAYLCYHKKKRVLVWDWDYEAPGLHYFFGKKNIDITRQGTLELLEAYMSIMRKSKEDIHATDLTYITQNNITALAESDEGCIDLMAAGIYNSDFSFRATNFDWFEFYNMLDGVNYIEQLKKQLQTLNYDYILIDSRTGISDYSGICNIQLPDVNVMVVAATMQNFEGCKSIIEKIQNAEYLKIVEKESKILPVLSRTDTGSNKYAEWELRFKDYFSPVISNLDNSFDKEFLSEIFTDVYYRDTFIPYTQAFSAGENILFFKDRSTLDSDPNSRPFRNIAEYLEELNRDNTLRFYKGIGERDWVRYTLEAENPRKAAIAWTQVAIKQSDVDEVIKYCEKAIDKDKTYYLPYYHAAIALSTKGESYSAIKYLEDAVRLKPDFADAHYLLASEKLNIGDIEDGKKSLSNTLKLNPNHIDASQKLKRLEGGNFTVNESRVKEDQYITSYVNTQIEQSKKVTETLAQKKIKKVAFFSFLIAAFLFLIMFVIDKKTKSSGTTSDETDIVTLTTATATSSLEDLTDKIKAYGINDTSFLESTAEEVNTLNQTYSREDDYFWVYIGERAKKGWSVNNFEFDDISTIKFNLTAIANIYKRDKQPYQNLDSNWKLGKVVGFIEEGQTISIEKIDSLTSEVSKSVSYWALAKVNNSDFWVVELSTHPTLEKARYMLKTNYKRLPNLRIIENKEFYYSITTQNFNTQKDAYDFIKENRKSLPDASYALRLSTFCQKLGFKEFYFVCQ